MTRSKRRKFGTSAAPQSTFNMDFFNIRGLHENINAVHQHLETAKPTLLFLTETQISSPADTSYLLYLGYKLEHKFVRRAGVCLYVPGDICYRRLLGLEDKDLSVLWVRVDQGDYTGIYACLYRSHSGDEDTTRLFEHLQLTSDKVLEQHPSARLVIPGDFNAHHTEWLRSRLTDHAGRTAHEFALTYGFSQLSSLLDLLLATHPDGYSVTVEAQLGSSDHCLIRSQVPCTSPAASRPPCQCRMWHYKSADWDRLREFYASYPWKQYCFASEDVDTCTAAVTEVILAGMKYFIPNFLVASGAKKRPWFNKSCRQARQAKQTAFQAWTTARSNNDIGVSDARRNLNAASRFRKRAIARANND
ncbi:uncharacterized protein LOC131841721 [Achroia grisella]|uniref:uncharacterized protein LOC131841721 n=1 Tax=Achroia grisella TaxID=688607 RepID=UPI0027D33BB4|nr:uncharacterized protein LOC131841721 [Achroia grisella]